MCLVAVGTGDSCIYERTKSHHVIRRNDVFHDVTVLLPKRTNCFNVTSYLNCGIVLTTRKCSSAYDLRHHWELPGLGSSTVTGSLGRMIEQGNVGSHCCADVLNAE